MVGSGATVGAFLVFGMTPLATAPSARAEIVDEVIDQILSPFMDATPSSVDWDALLTPTAWDAFLDPAHWDAVFADLSALGAGAGNGGADHAALFAAPAVSDSSTPDLTASFQQFIYTPLHTDIEDWIHSDVGQQVDGAINKLAGSYVIGDGTAGTADHPDAGAAGWLFGDGGAGWDSTYAGIPGGDGGAAGIFGDGGAGGAGDAGVGGGGGGAGGSLMGIGGAGGTGGAGDVSILGGVGGAGGAGGDAPGALFGVGGAGGNGGDGAAAAAGGNGGDGGNGTGLWGSGGDGGDAGNSGAGATGLPALGGAGGNGGVFGSHGAIGDHGTLTEASPSAAGQAPTTS
ncbi:MAG: PGRS repeat-containing protein, partial [Mycobacterium sp.]